MYWFRAENRQLQSATSNSPLHNRVGADHIIPMPRILPFLMLTAVGACALPQTHWEKEGSDETMAMTDLGSCRKAARDESLAAYPFGYPLGFPATTPPASPFYGVSGSLFWDQNRVYAETRLTKFCMHNKGYQLVTVAPPTVAPPQAAAPVSP
jgi:hypothetical protein